MFKTHSSGNVVKGLLSPFWFFKRFLTSCFKIMLSNKVMLRGCSVQDLWGKLCFLSLSWGRWRTMWDRREMGEFQCYWKVVRQVQPEVQLGQVLGCQKEEFSPERVRSKVLYRKRCPVPGWEAPGEMIPTAVGCYSISSVSYWVSLQDTTFSSELLAWDISVALTGKTTQITEAGEGVILHTMDF